MNDSKKVRLLPLRHYTMPQREKFGYMNGVTLHQDSPDLESREFMPDFQPPFNNPNFTARPEQHVWYQNYDQFIIDVRSCCSQEMHGDSMLPNAHLTLNAMLSVKDFGHAQILDTPNETSKESSLFMLQDMQHTQTGAALFPDLYSQQVDLGGILHYDLRNRIVNENTNLNSYWISSMQPFSPRNPTAQIPFGPLFDSKVTSFSDPQFDGWTFDNHVQVSNLPWYCNAMAISHLNEQPPAQFNIPNESPQHKEWASDYSSLQQEHDLFKMNIITGSKQKQLQWDNHGGRQKYRHQLDDWERMRELHIKRLVTANHTIEEMVFELDIIHDFSTSAKTLGNKLRAWGTDFKRSDRRRPAQALVRKKNKLAISDRLFRRKTKSSTPNCDHKLIKDHQMRSIPASLILELFVCQETIFHELDVLLKGCFDTRTKGRGWAPGVSGFIPPQGVSCNSKTWFWISAQCSGIALLSDAKLYSHIIPLFGEILKSCTRVAQCCDPNMFLHFWAISKSLCHIRFPEGRIFVLQIFLEHLRIQFTITHRNHPLVRFLTLLIRVSKGTAQEFHTTMALAYWKTIHTLTNSCGIRKEHRIILKMASRCSKDWRSKFEAHYEFLNPLFQVNLHSLEGSSTATDKQKIGFQHEYTEFIAKGKYNTKDCIEDRQSQRTTLECTIKLWRQSKRLCQERAASDCLKWRNYTEAFVFSTEFLAKYHIGCLNEHGKTLSLHHDRNKGYDFMAEAIEILRFGDVQCRIRAFSSRGV